MNAMLLGTSASSRFLAVQPWYTCLPLATQERVQASLVQINGKKGDVMLPAGQRVQGCKSLINYATIALNSTNSWSTNSASVWGKPFDIPDDHALTQFISQPSPAPAQARDNAIHEPANHP